MADLFVRAGSGDSAVGASTISFTLDGTGGDLLTVLPAFNVGASPDTVSTVKYAGSSCTFKDFVTSAGGIRIECWTKTAPPTGVNTVLVTFTANLNHSCCAGAQLFNGTNQTTPLINTTKNTSSAGNSTITLTSIGAANSGFDMAASGNNVTAPSQTTSYTDNNQSIGSGGSHAAGNGSKTFTWTIGGAWAAMAFEVQAASGGSVPFPSHFWGDLDGLSRRAFKDRLAG